MHVMNLNAIFVEVYGKQIKTNINQTKEANPNTLSMKIYTRTILKRSETFRKTNLQMSHTKVHLHTTALVWSKLPIWVYPSTRKEGVEESLGNEGLNNSVMAMSSRALWPIRWM